MQANLLFRKEITVKWENSESVMKPEQKQKGRVVRGPVGYFWSGGEGCLSPDSGASVGSSFSIKVINSPLLTHGRLSIERIAQGAS